MMLARKMRPVTKPDVDNLAKSVLDAINGVAYKDDNQIVDLVARKVYADIPFVKVFVSDWEPKEETA
jgi:Holliday junction resolvase RusA-like endonuclease